MLNQNAFHPKTLQRVIYGLLCGMVIVLFVSACNSKEKTDGESDDDKGGTKKALCFYSVKYDSATIANWLASGKKTARFVFQFYTKEANRYDTCFQAASYVLDSMGAYSNGMSPDILAPDYKTKASTFTGIAFMGNSMISRTRLIKAITDKNGNPLSYDYLLLIPKKDTYNYIVYELKPVKSNAFIPEVDEDNETKPSPPAPPGDENK